MARLLLIRPEQPPDDTTVVLRAGVMSGDDIRRAAARTFAIYGLYGISVEGVIRIGVRRGNQDQRRRSLPR